MLCLDFVVLQMKMLKQKKLDNSLYITEVKLQLSTLLQCVLLRRPITRDCIKAELHKAILRYFVRTVMMK